MCIPKITGGGGGSLLIQSGVLLTIGTCYIVKVRVKGTHHDNKNYDWKGGGYLFRMGLYTILVKWGWGPQPLTDSEWGCANYFSKNEGGAAYPAGGGH